MGLPRLSPPSRTGLRWEAARSGGSPGQAKWELGPGWRVAVGAACSSGTSLGVALPRASALRPRLCLLQINGVASEDLSLADTQRLIERTEGILTLHVLRDDRQFLVNIPDIEGSRSDSSSMDGEGTW